MWILSFSNTYSAGLFVGISFMHILPEAEEKFLSPTSTSQSPVPSILALMVFCLVLYLEKVQFADDHMHAHGEDEEQHEQHQHEHQKHQHEEEEKTDQPPEPVDPQMTEKLQRELEEKEEDELDNKFRETVSKAKNNINVVDFFNQYVTQMTEAAEGKSRLTKINQNKRSKLRLLIRCMNLRRIY